MARLFYGGSGADVIARRVAEDDDTLQLTLDVTYDVYTARTGGDQVTDLLDVDDNPITEVTPDENGVRFQGPDGTTAGLWLQNQADEEEPRWRVVPADQDIRPEWEAFQALHEGTAFADIAMFAGVDPTGVTECSAEIQDALDFIAAAGLRAYAKGTFQVDSTVTFAGNADFGDANFEWTPGSGTAVRVGTDSSGDEVFRLQVVLPQITATAKTTTGWSEVAGSVGVDISNLYSSKVYIPHINNFETGVRVYGKGTGCVYNDFFIGHLENNKVNLLLDADSTGWSNENIYYGGRYHLNSGEGTNVSGTRHIKMAVTTNGINNNIFIKPSVEGNVPEYHVEVSGGYNRLVNGRYEASPAKVLWQSNAGYNVIDGGYGSGDIVETQVSGALRNDVRGHNHHAYTMSGGAGGNFVLENTFGSSSPTDIIMAAGAKAAGATPSTGYCVARGAQYSRFKRDTDTYDRMVFDHENGRIYMGNAAAAPTAYLGPLGATAFGVVGGTFHASPDNTHDWGSSSLRPRYIRAGTAVVTGAGATGSRPSASTAGAGAMFFDTTLGKPIWSDGSGWVDATGASA